MLAGLAGNGEGEKIRKVVVKRKEGLGGRVELLQWFKGQTPLLALDAKV